MYLSCRCSGQRYSKNIVERYPQSMRTVKFHLNHLAHSGVQLSLSILRQIGASTRKSFDLLWSYMDCWELKSNY